MRRSVTLVIATLLVTLTAAPVFADATAFIGAVTTPSNRQARGFALGVGLLIVGFEFEYGNAKEDVQELAPSLRTGMANVLLQTPVAIMGLQPYITTGAGGYREQVGGGDIRQETNVGLNTGGGVKVSLLGPLRARFDYRVFKLRGNPLHDVVHRFYVGVNVAF
jgi:opacity protein-like surface antigen